MTHLFDFLSFSPGPFWLLIGFLPGNAKAMRAVDFYLFFLSALFAALTLPDVPGLLPVIAKPTLTSIQGILGSEKGTLGAWNHMILADLWIGRWVAMDSLSGKYAALTRAVFIPPILFFGPLGLFFYLVYRLATGRFQLQCA